MKTGDYLLYTLDGDTTNPPTTFVAEILSVDPANAFFTCRPVDTDQTATVQYSITSSGPWGGQNVDGSSISMATHDIYVSAGTDPEAQGAALVTLADGGKYFGSVKSVSPTIDVVFYQQPNPELSIDTTSTIIQSSWDAYPVGTQISSIEAYTLDNTLPQTTQPATTVDGDGFTSGLWAGATHRAAHPGRVGAAIKPFAVVVHTTDIPPDTFRGLVTRWTTTPGLGDGAHFIIGRDATDGVIQLVPVTSNANHAGGKAHGWFVANGTQYHPNSVSVGIEVHCAGILKSIGGQWRWVEDGVAKGAPIPDEDVIPDATRANVGYHTVTQYQYEQLTALLEALESQLSPLPDGCTATSAEQPPAWGVFPAARRVGHVTLDAANRGDPWPPTCEWMRTS